VAHELGIYAYDAYFIACAQRRRCPLVSLDRGLLAAAAGVSVQTIEVAT
jgi:predicted nucleic acid-binding protein